MSAFVISGATGRRGAGASSFAALLNRLTDISDQTVLQAGEDVDGRDYQAAAREIEASLAQHLFEASDQRREGYVRALTDLLVMVADGVLPGDGWDPLTNTAQAFSGKKKRGEA